MMRSNFFGTVWLGRAKALVFGAALVTALLLARLAAMPAPTRLPSTPRAATATRLPMVRATRILMWSLYVA